jgi:hypothetical protein
MGNILRRSNEHDIELQMLQGSASDENNAQKCDCVDAPETKCLHWAIKEGNNEYAN